MPKKQIKYFINLKMTIMLKRVFFYLKSNPGFLFYRLKTFVKNDLLLRKFKDDFDWDLYTTHYKAELRYNSANCLLIINPSDYIFINNKLICNIINKTKLQSNHHLLYETILILNPKSIIEFGCGGGDHLKNLNTLNNIIQLNAYDRSIDQINLSKKRHPNLNANFLLQNITELFSLPQGIQVAYSHAVIMHIKDGHMQALENMFNTALNQVVLMENWFEHDFFEDIHQLFIEKRIKWDNLFLYTSSFENSKILIASRIKLFNFKELLDKSQLF